MVRIMVGSPDGVLAPMYRPSRAKSTAKFDERRRAWTDGTQKGLPSTGTAGLVMLALWVKLQL
jgi:hypothetical protein